MDVVLVLVVQPDSVHVPVIVDEPVPDDGAV